MRLRFDSTFDLMNVMNCFSFVMKMILAMKKENHKTATHKTPRISYLVQWAGSNVEYSLFLTRESIAKLCTKLFKLKQLINAMATVTLNEFNILFGVCFFSILSSNGIGFLFVVVAVYSGMNRFTSLYHCLLSIFWRNIVKHWSRLCNVVVELNVLKFFRIDF